MEYLSAKYMIEGYVPASDSNNPTTYAAALSQHTGLSTDTVLSTMTDAQLENMMDAMGATRGLPCEKGYAQGDYRSHDVDHRLGWRQAEACGGGQDQSRRAGASHPNR
jgi:hypothetical protein